MKTILAVIVTILFLGCNGNPTTNKPIFVDRVPYNFNGFDTLVDPLEDSLRPWSYYITNNLATNSLHRWYQIDSMFNIGTIDDTDAGTQLHVYRESPNGMSRGSALCFGDDEGVTRYDSDVLVVVDTDLATYDGCSYIIVTYSDIYQAKETSFYLELDDAKFVISLECQITRWAYIKLRTFKIEYDVPQNSHRMADLFPLEQRKLFFRSAPY